MINRVYAYCGSFRPGSTNTGALNLLPGVRDVKLKAYNGRWVGKVYYAQTEDGRIICYPTSKWGRSWEVFK